MNELRELRPRGAGWVRRESTNPLHAESVAESWWTHGAIVAGSSLVRANLPVGEGTGLQWLVSVSENGRRPTRAAVRFALKAFGMMGAEEDNHHPGVARHFWRPLAKAERVDCQCKADERTITEPGGYRWTTPKDVDAEGCRGCEYEAMLGAPCPIHRAGVGLASGSVVL